MTGLKALSAAVRHAQPQEDAQHGHSKLGFACASPSCLFGCAELQSGAPRVNLPHGYIAQSASDLMLFTNPLVQDTLPADWESRCPFLITSAAQQLPLLQHRLPLMHVDCFC